MTLSLQVFVTTESSLCMFSHDLTLSSTVEALNLKESPAMCSGGGGERWYPDMVVIRSSYHVYTSPTIVSRTKKNIFRSSGYRAGKTQGICVCDMHMICWQSPSYHQQRRRDTIVISEVSTSGKCEMGYVHSLVVPSSVHCAKQILNLCIKPSLSYCRWNGLCPLSSSPSSSHCENGCLHVEIQVLIGTVYSSNLQKDLECFNWCTNQGANHW